MQVSDVRFLYQKEIERPGKREKKGEGEGERERWRDGEMRGGGELGSCDIIAKSVRH